MRAARVALAVALFAAAGAAEARRDEIDLLNISLGPAYASWLIGPFGEMASDREVAEFQRLTSDADAAAWVEGFWERRDPDPQRPGNPVREAAEERALEADRRFTEAGIAGRRTDRGTIFVLHGEPEEVEFEPSQIYGDPPLEIWRYPKDAGEGLDGEKPARRYRFAKRDDLTRFYVPGDPKSYTQRRPAGAPR